MGVLDADESVETNLKTHDATFKNLSVFDGNPHSWQKIHRFGYRKQLLAADHK